MSAINSVQTLFGIFFTIYFSLVIDRLNRMYRPFDTYSVWQGSSHALVRLLTAWLIIIFLPLVQFSVILILLGGIDITFDLTISNVIVLVAIGFLSFFCWGYQRIYEAIIHLRPSTFYPEEERSSFIKEERQEFIAHFVPGLLYVLSSVFLLIIVFLLAGR